MTDELPSVSICTPTYNRRPFIQMAIQCFQNYDYPRDKLEWIIVDDGTDNIESLVKNIPGVKYYFLNDIASIGKKRILMNEKATGDIIIYQDDDDYYPPSSSSRCYHAKDES